VAILVLHHRPKDGGEYRGTTAIAAAAQLGFTLSKAKEDPDHTRRRLHCWKCRPAAEPEDRWLHLGAERGMVLVGAAEPHVAADVPETAPAPRRDGFVPRILAALDGSRLTLTDIARTIGANPTDGSLRRAVDHLLAASEIVRGDDKKYERCRLPGATGPTDAGNAATGNSPSRAESGNGHQGNLDEYAEAEIERIRSKFGEEAGR
jgi:hypothetical protein